MQGWAPAPAPALTPTGDVTAALRVASWAIDAAVLAVVALLLNAILPSVPATFLLFCAFVAYTVVLPMKGFATVGHIAIGLRVVRTDGEGPVDWLALGTRAAVLLILAATVHHLESGSTHFERAFLVVVGKTERLDLPIPSATVLSAHGHGEILLHRAAIGQRRGRSPSSTPGGRALAP